MYLRENSKKLVNRMYNIGNKVLTEYGSGKIKKIDELEKTVTVKLDDGINVVIYLERDFIKPNSAHDKLIELGFTFLGKWTNGGEYDDYRYKLDDLWFLQIFHNLNDHTYYTWDGRSDLVLSRILTEYLEELNHE